jgi:hypothetical protein
VTRSPDLARQLSVLFNPLAGVSRQVYIAFPLVQSLATWVVDLSLLVRLVAVFPLAATPTRKFVGVFAVPTVVKAARLSLIAMSIVQYAPTVMNVSDPTAETTSNFGLLSNPMLIAEYSCELIDHL